MTTLTPEEKKTIERLKKIIEEKHCGLGLCDHMFEKTITPFLIQEIRDARGEKVREILKSGSFEEIDGCQYFVIHENNFTTLKGES